MLLYFLLAAIWQGNGAQAEADAQLCGALQRYEAQQRPTLPKMVDEVTRMDRLQVDCPGRAMTLHKTLIGDPANLVQGWQERKQAEWNRLACGSDYFRGMISRGWRVVERTSFSDGREIAFEARCS